MRGTYDSRLDTIKDYGFVDPTETTISFDDATYTFTLTMVGTHFSYWREGSLYHGRSTETVTLPGAPPADGMYFIYIDSTDGSLTQSMTPWTLEDTKVPVAIVAWCTAGSPRYFLADERHTCLINRRYHWEHHFADGAELISGANISGYVVQDTAPASNADNTFGIAQTIFADEDIKVTNALLADPAGTWGDPNYTILYKNGAALYWWFDNAVPYPCNAGGYIKWNNGTTLTNGVSGKYYTSYLLATNFAGDGRYMILPGRGEYSTISEALSENIGNFDFTGFPVAECVVAYQFVWATDASYTTDGKCRLCLDPVGIMSSVVTLRLKSSTYSPQTLDELSDVTLTSPAVDQVLKFDGTQWRNGPGVTAGAGPGVTFFQATPAVITAGAQSAYGVSTLSKTPVVAGGTLTYAGTVTNNTVLMRAFLYGTALGRTSFDAGIWDFNTYAYVSSTSGGRNTTITRGIYQVVPGTGTLTATGGPGTTSRTFTASSGTPFVAGDANASLLLCGYIQTPSGFFPISGFTGGAVVTGATLATYTDEAGVAYKVWKRLFSQTTPTITSLSPNFLSYDAQSAQAAFAVAATDRIGSITFATGTSGSSTVATVAYNGSTNNTNVQTPWGVLHDELGGLNAAGGNYQHLTDADKTDLTDGGDTTLHKHDIYLAKSPYPTKSLWLSASGAVLPVTTPAVKSTVEISATKEAYDILTFGYGGGTGVAFADWAIAMPGAYDGGTIAATFYYTTSATDAGTQFVWQIKAASFASGDALDGAWGTTQVVAAAVPTVNNLGVVSLATAMTPSGTPAPGELMQFRVIRDAAYNTGGVEDTSIKDARLIGVLLKYTTNAWTD